MQKRQKIGFYCLFIAVISDFLTPYILGVFYPQLNQLTDVMSLFGEVGSPVRGVFLVWSVVAGSFYVCSLPAIYQTSKDTSKSLAISLVMALGLYGVGDCIFTGLFSIDTEQAQWNISTWIHNIGSGVGYAGFFIFSFLLYLLNKKQKNLKKSRVFLNFFYLNIIIALLYGCTRVPIINQLTIFSLVGLWQRMSFFCNYLPIIYYVIDYLKSKKIVILSNNSTGN